MEEPPSPVIMQGFQVQPSLHPKTSLSKSLGKIKLQVHIFCLSTTTILSSTTQHLEKKYLLFHMLMAWLPQLHLMADPKPIGPEKAERVLTMRLNNRPRRMQQFTSTRTSRMEAISGTMTMFMELQD